MKRTGDYKARSTASTMRQTRKALRAFTGRENLEDRTFLAEGMIDPPAMEYVRGEVWSQKEIFAAKN